MQTRNPILDDLARVAAGALGVAAGMRKEAEALLKQRFAAVLGREGFVTREEFDAVKAMAAKARTENEALERRIAELEAGMRSGGAQSKRTRAPASRRRKTAAKPAAEKPEPKR